ncbi:MAG: hypothetical protein Q7R39_15040 [Dehalococcoidia bacterium]|nr:hypothetical protein [Dehalococcoidia bacterium]
MFRLVSLGLLVLLVLGGWLSLGLVVVWTGPEPLLSRVLFFVLLFVTTLATASLVSYALGSRLFALKRDRGRIGLSLAQGLPVCFAVTFAAWLQSLRLLGWANAVILVSLLGVLEYVLMPKGSR